jgi:NAD+ diphosphatase
MPVKVQPEPAIPSSQDLADRVLALRGRQYLGYLDGSAGREHYFAAEVEGDAQPPPGMAFMSLRALFGRLTERFLGVAGRAIQIVEWDRTHQYCGRCGVAVEQVPHERAKRCPQCHLTTYPRLSPAIIVRVLRRSTSGQAEILLAHNRRQPPGFYSVLAGFVEPGETLEECVRREIREEVGLEVTDLKYFVSQPWPFPHSLMIAFTAEHRSGEITLEDHELEDANWYRPDDLPQLPPPASIARQLIDDFVRGSGRIT